MSENKIRLKRETQGAFCVLNANAKSQTRKSMKINVICTVPLTVVVMHFLIYVRIPCNILLFIEIKYVTVQITFIFIDFRVCDFAFAFKTQNAPCVSRFKRVLFSDRFQFAF